MIYRYLSINHDAFDCMRCYFRCAMVTPTPRRLATEILPRNHHDFRLVIAR